MRYKVCAKLDGRVRLETDDFEEARIHAVRDSNWNIPDDVIDTETGETVLSIPAYRDTFHPGEPATIGWEVVGSEDGCFTVLRQTQNAIELELQKL